MRRARPRVNAVVGGVRRANTAGTKALLSDNPAVARDGIHQAIGYMFRKKIDRPLLFVFRKPRKDLISMMFVSTPIDVLLLDDDGVVLMRKRLFPWSFWLMPQHCRYVLEMPVGERDGGGSVIGKKVVFHSWLNGKNLSMGDVVALDQGTQGFWTWRQYLPFFAVHVMITVLILVAIFFFLDILV